MHFIGASAFYGEDCNCQVAPSSGSVSKSRFILSQVPAGSAPILDSVTLTVFAGCRIVLSIALRLSVGDHVDVQRRQRVR